MGVDAEVVDGGEEVFFVAAHVAEANVGGASLGAGQESEDRFEFFC